MTRVRAENMVHKALVQYLNIALPQGAVHFFICNEGQRSPAEWQRLKNAGFTKGIPDHFIMWNGIVVFMEIKRPQGGRVSKEQREMQARLKAQGAIVGLVLSPEDAEGILTKAGIPLRAHHLPFPRHPTNEETVQC